MDGGSKDESVSIIEKYADCLAYWQTKPDGGAAAALNSGFARSRGTILAYLNSDDYLFPDAVECWATEFARNPEADLVYGDILIVDKSGNPTTLPGKRVHTYKASRPGSRRRMASGGFPIPQQACACRRAVHLAVGGFNVENTTCWDGEYYADAAIRAMNFHQVKQTLAAFRMHEAAITGGQKHQDALLRDHQRISAKWAAVGIRPGRLEMSYQKLIGRAQRALRYLTEREDR
jgi:glycosyltransferase involved in cell wall biosynthesis